MVNLETWTCISVIMLHFFFALNFHPSTKPYMGDQQSLNYRAFFPPPYNKMSLSLTTIIPSQLLLFLCKYLFMTFLLPNSFLYIFLQWGFLLVNLFMSPSKAERINCLYSFSNKKTALCCLVVNIKSCSKFSFFHDARCLFSLSTIKKKKNVFALLRNQLPQGNQSFRSLVLQRGPTLCISSFLLRWVLCPLSTGLGMVLGCEW